MLRNRNDGDTGPADQDLRDEGPVITQAREIVATGHPALESGKVTSWWFLYAILTLLHGHPTIICDF